MNLIKFIESGTIIAAVIAIVGAIITYWLNKNKEIEFQKRETKHKRYRTCLTFMYSYLNPTSKNIAHLARYHSDISNISDIRAYLEVEYYEMMFYASKHVVLALKKFIENPNDDIFLKTILAMRKDMWGKSDLQYTELTSEN